jgi:hypothetical protein
LQKVLFNRRIHPGSPPLTLIDNQSLNTEITHQESHLLGFLTQFTTIYRFVKQGFVFHPQPF